MNKSVFVLILVSFLSSFAFAEKILILGDSHTCGSFGQSLLKDLTSRGNTVTVFCNPSSAPTHWLTGKNANWVPKIPGECGKDTFFENGRCNTNCKTMTSNAQTPTLCNGDGHLPKLADILAQNRGSRVIIAFGTNSMAPAEIKDKVTGQVKEIPPSAGKPYTQLAKLAKANGSGCDWIGPPHFDPSKSKGFPSGRVAGMEKYNDPDNKKNFFDSLRHSVEEQCNLHDSRPFTKSGTPGFYTADGIHRGVNKATHVDAGKYWADQLVGSLTHVQSAPSSGGTGL